MSSVKKTNNELHRLDVEIRKNITKARSLADRAARLTSAQAPIGFRATLSGISGGSKKKKSVKKRTPKKTIKKRKVVKKKEITKKK